MTYHAVGITFALLSFGVCLGKSDNLTCYQCIKQVNEECSQQELKPCAPEKDRCVTHITKDEDIRWTMKNQPPYILLLVHTRYGITKNGFFIKRECGLGPCGFDDDMMNRGLGLDGCDRSKHEYFCLFCCRTSGCNKSSAYVPIPSCTTIFLAMISIVFIYFQFMSVKLN